MNRESGVRCDTDDHKMALLKQHIPRLDAAVAELWHCGHPHTETSAYIRQMYDNVNYKVE
jgi:hypothetical protein